MARFAVLLVLFSVVGCRTSGKWPGLAWGRNKEPAYSTASSAPPAYAGLPSAAGAAADYSGAPASPYGKYAETPNSDAGAGTSAAVAQDGYPSRGGYGGGGGYPAQTAGSGATQAGPYDSTYPEQDERPASYAGGAVTNPYVAGQGRDYGDYRSGASGGSLGQDPLRTADARGAQAARYDATSRYDAPSPYNSPTQYGADPTAGQELDRYPPATSTGNRYASDATSPIQATSVDSDYQPGRSDYQPGATGYAPPGVGTYQGAGGSAGASGADPHYRPGGTRDYLPAGSGAGTAPPNHGSRQTTRPGSPAGSIYADTVDESYGSSAGNDRYGDYRDPSGPLAPPEVNVALPPR
ncbi:MAG: hypothetical protein WD847_09320 [Pirellulales bacterium]